MENIDALLEEADELIRKDEEAIREMEEAEICIHILERILCL